MTEIYYRVVKGCNNAKDGKYRRYAIEAEENGAVVQRFESAFNDRAYAEKFAALCNETGDVLPENVKYILEDFKWEIMNSI